MVKTSRSSSTIWTRFVKTGRTRADDLIDRFNGDWGGSIEPVFTEAAY